MSSFQRQEEYEREKREQELINYIHRTMNPVETLHSYIEYNREQLNSAEQLIGYLEEVKEQIYLLMEGDYVNEVMSDLMQSIDEYGISDLVHIVEDLKESLRIYEDHQEKDCNKCSG